MSELKQQIRQMQGLKINGIYVLNSSQRNILDDVIKKLADCVCIPKNKLEEFVTWLKEREQSTKQEFRQKGWKDVKCEITVIREKFEQMLLEDSK